MPTIYDGSGKGVTTMTTNTKILKKINKGWDTKPKICPTCGEKYSGYPALSRRDNKTHICSDCGVKEALMDFIRWKAIEDSYKKNL